MKTMPAGEFKAKCLRLMDEVQRRRQAIVITKKGRPVAKLVPVDEPTQNVFGCRADTLRIVGDVEAPVLSPKAWKALR